MPRSRPRYPAEYRQQMVDLVRSGRSPDQLAREFEPSAQSIRNWVAQADRDEGPAATDGTDHGGAPGAAASAPGGTPVARGAGDPGKSNGLVRAGDGTEGVFRFMRAHQAEFRITTMARVLGVSTSGYYAWLKRPRSAREKSDAALVERMQAIHMRSRGTYGAPRIQAELADDGVLVSRKRVARLMRESGLSGVSRRKRPTTTRRAASARPAPDLVDREFAAEAPDRLWLADITYVPTLSGFLYLAVVLDVFSRRIVGWAMDSSLATELVVGALEMAIAQRRPEEVIHHSDQGSQYTSLAFGKRCRDAGIALSMGSVGDCYDNAMAESFFASLECELLDRTTFRNRAEAKTELFRWIEGWYNPHRRHSGIGHRSPINFERSYCEAA